MNGRSILAARIQALSQDLAQAGNALEATKVDDELRQRVRVPFGDLIAERLLDLKRLRKLIESNSPIEEGWTSFQNTSKDCESLLKECLDFIQGALARDAEVDFGLCRIADALLMEIGHRSDISWTRFTVLAVGEFFHDIAEIIRLRFPDSTIWNLPVACHEFGHFAEQNLSERYAGKTRYPIQQILELERFHDPTSIPFLRELFADLFATYALGPAYACSCILLRFDPSRAYFDGAEHPSSAKRVYFILKALDKMDKSVVTRPYRTIIENLSDVWQQSVIPQGGQLEEAQSAQLNVWLEKFYAALNKKHSLQYVWGPASALIPVLMSNSPSDKTLKQIAQPNTTLSDVLNAAWICRLQCLDNGSQVYQIGENAKRLCLELSAKPH